MLLMLHKIITQSFQPLLKYKKKKKFQASLGGLCPVMTNRELFSCYSLALFFCGYSHLFFNVCVLLREFKILSIDTKLIFIM